jgi:DNA replication factor GINS
MTREEREMFESIVSEIRASQERIEETLEDALKNGDTVPESEDEPRRDTDDEAAKVTDSGEDEPEQESEADGYTTVRVVESLPEFVGTDGREYSLGQEDVARIPEENARALCEKEAAIEVGRKG